MSKLYSTDCIADDFETRWYKKWASIIGYPSGKHPKFWETAAIAEILQNSGYLKTGKKGLGMGVGTEPLASLFAKYGVSITATDQDPNEEKSHKWNNGQLAHNKESLFYPLIIDKKSFQTNVSYQSYDMNKDNESFHEAFDFIWHNCVIGHLGSMENSINHLKRSGKFLKKDGALVFTTELNISNLESTVMDNSDTIIWRLADIERLFKEMAEIGMIADRLSLRLGSTKHDTRINYNHITNLKVSPTALLEDSDYSEIKIPFSNYAITQIILCFRKTNKKSFRTIKSYEKDTISNALILKKHLDNNADLKDYYTNYTDIEMYDAELTPEQKDINIEITPGSLGKIELRYFNKSELRLFDFSFSTPLGKAPLVLGTFDPVNRKSMFSTQDWPSPNRPSTTFALQKSETLTDWNEHRVDPGRWFEYSFNIKAPNKPGIYKESFCLIFEGKAVPPSSVVTITITVKSNKKAKKDKNILTISEYFKKSRLSQVFSKKVQNDFERWLKLAAKREFRYRYCIGPQEFSSLLESYVTHYFPKVKFDKKLLTKTSTDNKHNIKINHPSLVRGLRSRLVLQISNPRVGGTLFNEIIGSLTGWPALQGGTIANAIDFNCISGPAILHMHLLRQDFEEINIPLPYKVVTVARNPIDTLISGFMFVQKNPYLNWLDGKVFPFAIKWKNLDPSSSEFYKWSMSKGAEAMLSVSKSWWNIADEVIKYEDYKTEPAESISRVLKTIDPEVTYTAAQIEKVVNKLDGSFLVNTKNVHRWNGGLNYAEKYIPADYLVNIRNYHNDAFEVLGYQ